MRQHFQPVGALHYGRMVLRFAALAVRHPTLVGPMLHAAWRFRQRRWWAKLPFLPLPARGYLEWRMETAFGSSGTVPSARQLERYLRWTRTVGRGMREGR